MLCFRIDVRLLKPFDQAARLLVVLHCNMQHVEKSQLHGALAVPTLDRRLHCCQGVAGHQPAVQVSTTRVSEGPYHTTQHSHGCPLRSFIAIRHLSRRTPLPLPTSAIAIPSLTRPPRSSSVSPAPAFPRSETSRTVASVPDTPSTSGIDKVRNYSSRDNPMPRKR